MWKSWYFLNALPVFLDIFNSDELQVSAVLTHGVHFWPIVLWSMCRISASALALLIMSVRDKWCALMPFLFHCMWVSSWGHPSQDICVHDSAWKAPLSVMKYWSWMQMFPPFALGVTEQCRQRSCLLLQQLYCCEEMHYSMCANSKIYLMRINCEAK